MQILGSINFSYHAYLTNIRRKNVLDKFITTAYTYVAITGNRETDTSFTVHVM